MSVFADGTLDGILRRSLGSRSMRAVRSPEIDDVSSHNVVDKTCLKKGEKSQKYESILSRYGRSAQGGDGNPSQESAHRGRKLA